MEPATAHPKVYDWAMGPAASVNAELDAVLVELLRFQHFRPHLLRTAALRLAADARDLDRLAASSWRHPNGFDKFILSSSPSGTLRLHVWWEPMEAATDAHNHVSHMVSQLVRGRLQETLYAVEASASPSGRARPGTLSQCHFTYPSTDGASRTTALKGRCTLVPVATRIIASGASYTIPADTIHTVRPVCKFPVVSLVAQAPAHRQVSDVITPKSKLHVSDQARPLSIAGLRHLLAEVASWCVRPR